MTVIIHTNDTHSLSEDEINAWQSIPVAIAADLCPEQQIDIAIRPVCVPGKQPKLCGRAVTALCEPPDFGAVLHATDLVKQGDVFVIAAGGRDDTAMIGEIVSTHLRSKGCVGVVCDGAVRDVATIAGWPDFSVFCRFVNPLGPTSAHNGKVQAPVMIGKRTVNPGDLILGDDDGLIALSPASARKKLDDALAKLNVERDWVTGLATGKTCVDVFGLNAAVRKTDMRHAQLEDKQ